MNIFCLFHPVLQRRARWGPRWMWVREKRFGKDCTANPSLGIWRMCGPRTSSQHTIASSARWVAGIIETQMKNENQFWSLHRSDIVPPTGAWADPCPRLTINLWERFASRNVQWPPIRGSCSQWRQMDIWWATKAFVSILRRAPPTQPSSWSLVNEFTVKSGLSNLK